MKEGHQLVDYEQRLQDLGIEVPDYTQIAYYGMSYGTMKPHHRVGNVLFLSGHIPEYSDGTILHQNGRLGKDLSIEQGYAAARLSGINAVAGMKYALGDLNRVVSLINSLNFVVCTPDFTDVNKVSSGSSDLFVEIFGEEIGLGARATIGITSLARGNPFENWVTVEVRD